MATLFLRHAPGSDLPRFVVARADGKQAPPVPVVPPAGFPVEGRSNLLAELRWYLEEFLDDPFSPWTECAPRRARRSPFLQPMRPTET